MHFADHKDERQRTPAGPGEPNHQHTGHHIRKRRTAGKPRNSVTPARRARSEGPNDDPQGSLEGDPGCQGAGMPGGEVHPSRGIDRPTHKMSERPACSRAARV